MDPRDELTAYLRRQLVGPAHGEDEALDAPPDRTYLCGTLYPQGADTYEHLSELAEEIDGFGIEGPSEDATAEEDPVPESNAWLPSSMGLSFFTHATTLRVLCKAARYSTEHGGRGRRWRRRALPAEVVECGLGEGSVPLFAGRGELRLRWRQFGCGHLVTVALVNSALPVSDEGRTDKWDRMLFQVELAVEPTGDRVRPYPSVRLTSRDPEEQELRLQYRHVRTHAVGHGCAVREDWDGGQVVRLAAEVMPTAEVPAIRASGPVRMPVLQLLHLADSTVKTSVLRAELEAFVADYRSWYEAQLAVRVPAWAKEAADRILERIETAVTRIESGIAALCDPSQPDLLEAFRAANHAMALQMKHSEQGLGGGRRSRFNPVALNPAPDPKAAWHPFQLAFFLSALESAADPNHSDRNVVDLIWFPTGGGKTEAYLLLAAFVMVLRRRRPNGAGTAVLSRYTLSLLTTQQFQRAATTVCALEYLRCNNRERENEPPYTIGLWVGSETSPNTYENAYNLYQELRSAAKPDNLFILDRCPWCGTRIVPERKSPNNADYGIRATTRSFAFYCPRVECEFHGELPVAVVDEHLYEAPPTFVLGTVDKFARLAWEPQAGRLFGADGQPPPQLVIQDELHLLSGPLGTLVGLYESAIISLCTRDGRGPKVIASTATIRRSQEQVRRLYGRDVQLFPPSGLDARFSYFAEPDDSRPGRLYLGVMAQGHTAGRATVATAAAMLQGAQELPVEHRDAYWTLVAYHHSLRELGRTVTAASDDIPAQLAELGARAGTGKRDLNDHLVQELTSNLPRTEQPVLLDRLEKPWTDPNAVSFLPCTNMLSVGVDVKRLALMLMLGQPKTTAEYIQATSRVGRHGVPGLVVTFFNATRPRDRSHYETFDVYHRSLYRQVEPTTVTPWSVPARKRALHAALVILARHRLGLCAETQAGEILDRFSEFEQIADTLTAWASESDPRVRNDVAVDLDRLLAEWKDQAALAHAEGKRLHYRDQGKGQYHLLKRFEQRGGLWETPDSMRSVDRECQVTVKGADR